MKDIDREISSSSTRKMQHIRKKAAGTPGVGKLLWTSIVVLALTSACQRMQVQGQLVVNFSVLESHRGGASKEYNEEWSKLIAKPENQGKRQNLMSTAKTPLHQDKGKQSQPVPGMLSIDEMQRRLKKDSSLGISTRGKGGKSSKSSKKSSKKSSSRSKSGKGGSGKGGKGKGDNVFDNGGNHPYPSSPVATPTFAPPPSGGSPTSNPPPSMGGTPTFNPPTFGSPVTTPTFNSPSMPSAPAVVPPSNREPPTSQPGGLPPPSNGEPRCSPGSDGLFGSQVGFAEEITFAYQLLVAPSVTAAELNLNALNAIEKTMGEEVLERLFDQCSPAAALPQRASDELEVSPVSGSTSTKQRGYIWQSSTNGRGGRNLRSLQASELSGFSTRPRDTVVEDAECVNVQRVFPCFVIRGRVTAYAEQLIPDSTVQSIEAALEAAFVSGGLDTADSRILEASWRDLSANPIPDDTNTKAPVTVGRPTQSPIFAPTPGLPTNGGPNPASRDAGSDGLETWMIAVIAVSGALLLCIAYMFLRSGQKPPVYEDDDGGASASSDEDFDDENQKKERKSLVGSSPLFPPARASQQRPTPVAEGDEDSSDSSSDSDNAFGRPGTSPPRRMSPPAPPAPYQDQPIQQRPNSESISELDEDSFDDEPIIEVEMSSSSRSSGFGAPNQQSAPAADSSNVSPFGGSMEVSDSQWNEQDFVQNVPPPIETTSEEFSSEYSEEEVEEEYEIEYVEEDDGMGGMQNEGEESYTDDWDEDETEEVEIVQDEPGKTPILPWLAQDGQ